MPDLDAIRSAASRLEDSKVADIITALVDYIDELESRLPLEE
jgi:hypothetical protein